jgi:hypothetical protein
MALEILEARVEGDWEYRRFNDGTEQWSYKNHKRYFVERVKDKRRKRWTIVDRHNSYSALYPPRVLKTSFDEDGPAKVALVLIVQSQS